MPASNHPLCILCGAKRLLFKTEDPYRHTPVQVLATSDPIGATQLYWIRDAGLCSTQDLQNGSNVIFLCGDHGCLYKTHAFALSPPLRDLALMEEWETKDWEERLESKLLRNRLPCPLEHLSGNVAFIWCATGDSGAASPAEFEFRINHVDDDGYRPCRLNPYFAMADAMDAVSGRNAPTDTFVQVARQESSDTPNNLEEYRTRLSRLRKLYSRTTESCYREREQRAGRPIVQYGAVHLTRALKRLLGDDFR